MTVSKKIAMDSIHGLLKNHVVIISLDFLFIISMGTFTFFMSLSRVIWEMCLGIAISLGVSAILAFRYSFVTNVIKKITLPGILAAVIVCESSLQFVRQKFWNLSIGKLSAPWLRSNTFIRWTLYLFFAIFVFLITLWAVGHITDFIKSFASELSKKETWFMLGGTLVLLIAIPFLYTTTSGFWNSYDIVYSIDSSYTYNEIFPNLYYNDIRHTLFNIIGFPIFSLVAFIARVLRIDAIKPIMMTIINAEFFLVIGLMLKKACANKFVLYLYMVSSPVWLFSVFFEKYTVSILFMVLFLYAVYKNHQNQAVTNTILSVGMMSTSVMLAPMLILGKKPKAAILCLVKTACVFLVVLVVIGKTDALVHVAQQLNGVMGFTKHNLTLLERVLSCFDCIASLIFVLPFKVDNSKFTWRQIGVTMNWFGLLVFILCIIGFVYKRKSPAYKVCGYWAAMLFVLFAVLNWAPHESPLFAVYFSWAYIPLLVAGIEAIFVKNRHYLNIVYGVVASLCICTNVWHLVHLTKFLQIDFP